MGANPEGVIRAARSFSAGGHRRALVGRRDGVSWVDDSKATNPHAALASIRSHGSVLLIAGGLAKGLDVTPLAREPNVRVVFGIGAEGPALVEAAGERGHLAGTLERAVLMAADQAEPGDTVLLAPGCASFDQFVSYAERGDTFTRLAREIVEEDTRR
jgi:UDP-N-acetylmuramoylalanine--D-glutamate ligase